MAQTHKSAKLKEFPTKYVLRDRQWLSSLITEVNKLQEDNFVALNSNQWSICEHKDRKEMHPEFIFKQKQSQLEPWLSYLNDRIYHYVDLIIIAFI